MITFIDALDDPKLLKPWTKRLDLSAWRVFHEAVDALPIPEADRELFTQCTGRLECPKSRAVEVYGEIGRRGFKTVNAALRCVYECCIRTTWQEHLAPGQQAIYAIISVDRQAAREAFNYCTGILHSTPLLKSMIDQETREEITLKNGAIIQIRVASYRSVRGPAYIGAILDELAFFADAETAANPASEIVAAISPAILPGGIIIGISSVFNRAGYLWETHKKYFGQDDSDILIWHASTLLMNPTFDRKKIDRDRAKDPAVAAAEYDSEWRDDIQSLYSAEAVDRAMIQGRGDLQYISENKYFAFVDPSGGRRDSAALAISHKDKTGRIILDMMIERKAPHNPAQVVEEFAGLMKPYHLGEVTGDRYAGEWPVAAYREKGIRYNLAEKTASELYLAALPLFSGGQIELPESERLRGQLCGLMRRTNSGGKDQVIAGQSDASHSDLANACMGAVVLAASHGVGDSIGFETNASEYDDDDDDGLPTTLGGALIRFARRGI